MASIRSSFALKQVLYTTAVPLAKPAQTHTPRGLRDAAMPRNEGAWRPPPAGAVSTPPKEHTMPETDWFPGGALPDRQGYFEVEFASGETEITRYGLLGWGRGIARPHPALARPGS